MRLRNIKGSRDAVKNHNYVVQEPKENKGKWRDVFGNTHPIYIEIGMGKGQFIIEQARRNPQINFVGIEKYSGVLYKALQGVEEADLSNLICLRVDALHLDSVFDSGEVDRVYLNFSDPWPKERHYKRRLTYKDFLKVYQYILKDAGDIIFKTDNRPLFDYSVKSMERFGFSLIEVNHDLHGNEPEDNIRTEYEERFSVMGFKINRLIALNFKGEINEDEIQS